VAGTYSSERRKASVENPSDEPGPVRLRQSSSPFSSMSRPSSAE
jgi:hypothetical protein